MIYAHQLYAPRVARRRPYERREYSVFINGQSFSVTAAKRRDAAFIAYRNYCHQMNIPAPVAADIRDTGTLGEFTTSFLGETISIEVYG